ncbi:MAG: SCO family protein [Brevinematales bacterium]|nr:SCO family protein [Brevinematales bacterium]
MKWHLAIVLILFIENILYSTPSMKHTTSFLDPNVMVIDEKNYIGKITKDFNFITEDGSTNSIKNFTKGKPTIILPIFFNCTTGCPLTLHSTLNSIQNIKRDFSLLVLSFDYNDTLQTMKEFKELHSRNYKDPRVKYAILTKDSLNNFTNSTGFKFFFSVRDNTFVHTLVLIFLSPEGKITRYLLGSNPKEGNISLALAEASISKFSINSIIDLAFLVCYSYDIKTRQYLINPTIIFGSIGIILVGITVTISIILSRRRTE